MTNIRLYHHFNKNSPISYNLLTYPNLRNYIEFLDQYGYGQDDVVSMVLKLQYLTDTNLIELHPIRRGIVKLIRDLELNFPSDMILWCCKMGYLKSLKLVLPKRKLTVSESNLLIVAVENDHLPVVKYLINRGCYHRKFHLLHLAIVGGHVKIVKYLLKFKFRRDGARDLAIQQGQSEIAELL